MGLSPFSFSGLCPTMCPTVSVGRDRTGGVCLSACCSLSLFRYCRSSAGSLSTNGSGGKREQRLNVRLCQCP